MRFQRVYPRLGPLALLVLAMIGGILSPAGARSPQQPSAPVVIGEESPAGGRTERVANPRLKRTEISYAVMAHGDDETSAWSWIEKRPLTYTVFVLMTQGEQTEFCLSADEVPLENRTGDPGLAPTPPTPDDVGDGDAGDDGELAAVTATGTITEGFLGGGYHLDNAGPWGYQGPNSPVGEPDKGERQPLGNPWQGKGSQACKDARVASWHWFLDAMATHDPTLASMGVAENPYDAPSYRGRFCDHGAKALGCARVWATGDGARVVFDAGDQDLSADKVIRGVNLVRHQRARWGLPAELQEAGVLAAVPGKCDEHVDHSAVQEAVYTHNFGAGLQIGTACDPNDPRYQENPAPPKPLNPAILLPLNMIDPLTEQRQGAYNVNYGWLWDTYVYTASATYAWQRFG